MRGLPARSFVNDDAVLSSSKRVSGRSGAAAARADMALAVLKAVVTGRFWARRVARHAVIDAGEAVSSASRRRCKSMHRFGVCLRF